MTTRPMYGADRNAPGWENYRSAQDAFNKAYTQIIDVFDREDPRITEEQRGLTQQWAAPVMSGLNAGRERMVTCLKEKRYHDAANILTQMTTDVIDLRRRLNELLSHLDN